MRGIGGKGFGLADGACGTENIKGGRRVKPATASYMRERAEQELGKALYQMFYSVLRVDPIENTVMILQSHDFKEDVYKEMDWTLYLKRYKSVLTEQGYAQLLERLSSEALLGESYQPEHRFSVEVSYVRNERTNWLTISVLLQRDTEDNPYAYVFVRQANEGHLLKSIIDKYVYNTCDFFVYLDARHNRYEVFGGIGLDKKGFLAKDCDYETAVNEFARRFVVPEDREMVIREMRLPRVLDMLNEFGVHSFYCGVLDAERGYTRKLLTYKFYDEGSQMILLSRTDVTAVYIEEQTRLRELAQAQEQAKRDSLTGILNHQSLKDQISRALEGKYERMALLFIDLDDFKQINDYFGHLQGDRILKKVAGVLEKQSAPMGFQGRTGGDEFIIFLTHIEHEEEAKKLAQQICHTISSLSLPEVKPLRITCSIGIATAPEDGCDYTTLVHAADRRAYQAKKEGKNRYYWG